MFEKKKLSYFQNNDSKLSLNLSKHKSHNCSEKLREISKKER